MAPWPWWFSGILIGLTVPLLYLLANKSFGISTSLQHIGAVCAPSSKLPYLAKYNRRQGWWLMTLVVGIALGGAIGSQLLSAEPIVFFPEDHRGGFWLAQLFVGGVLVGFGARYCGGCTSGHSITGISNFNWPSLVATIFFFVGGLAVTWGLGWLLFPE